MLTDRTDLPDRRVPLASAPNLRDLGGIPVGDGAVRPGLIYRSATLSGLSDDDQAGFSALGVHAVYDLRTAGEREAAPDRLPAGVEVRGLDVLADSTMNVAARVSELMTDPSALAASLAGDGATSLFEESYRDIVRLPSALAAYRRFFADLADPDRSETVLFHCTTGKDRTGWAAASFLLLIGADEDAVRADYLQTNADLLPALAPLLDQAEAAGVDRELLLPALGVQAEYLDAALAQVAEQFGDLAGYVTRGLGLDATVIDALRAKYVG